MSKPPDNTPYLSVIIPAYNEEDRIGYTLQSVIDFLSGQDYLYEILIVNDGSIDRTADIVSDFIRPESLIRIYNLEENSGKGCAVKHGMLNTNGRYRLFMDADNSTTIEHFDLMRPILDRGVDVVIGSRRTKGAVIAIHQNWLRENLGRVFNSLVKIIVGLPYKDTQAGFKAFSGKAAERIFTQQTIRGWAFDIELLVLAKQMGYEIQEVPIVWKNSAISHVTFSGMIYMLIDVLKINFIRKKKDLTNI